MSRRYARGAWVLFLVVLSHWPLDVLAHRPDMPLAPRVATHLGLGLWSSIPATLAVEGGFWLIAVVLYARATHPQGRAGVCVFWSVVLLLTLAWYNNIAGPAPPNARAASIASLIFFAVIVAWAYWMNRLRPTEAT